MLKNLKKSRSRLRAITRDRYSHESNTGIIISGEEVEVLCSRLNLQKLSLMVELFASNPDEAISIFREEVKIIREKDSNAFSKKELIIPQVVPSKPWTDQELSLLSKGLAKYPGGVQQRWELIAEFIGTRKPKEVIERTKLGKQVQVKPTDYQQEDAFNRFNKSKKKLDTEVQVQESVRDPSNDGEDNGEEVNAATLKEVDWSTDEQKALEKALQSFPASLTDRWDKIAEVVGKSKKDCVLRYKFLVSKIKEKSGK